jgi:RNA-directed DNA polymerase
LIFNIAMTVLDEHLHGPWRSGGQMSTTSQRVARRRKGLPCWRIVRYCDDFVVLVHGNRHDVEGLHEDIARVLAPLGLRLSPAKTRIVHMSEAFDFLGFRIQWRRKRGTNKWYVYTFIADRSVRSLKGKIRILTHRTSQQDLGTVLTRLNQIMHGWANYFRFAVAKHTFKKLENFAWRRVIQMMMERHHWTWKDIRRRLATPTGQWQRPSADGIELFDIATVTVRRYRYRGNTIPNPWLLPNHA